LKAHIKTAKWNSPRYLLQVNQSRVLVTFLESNGVDLRARGIDDTQAAELRARLKTFADDWERPEADIYDKDPAR
jgi:hypothetical protein